MKATWGIIWGMIIGGVLVFAFMYDGNDDPPVSDAVIEESNSERRDLEEAATIEAYFETQEERNREPAPEE